MKAHAYRTPTGWAVAVYKSIGRLSYCAMRRYFYGKNAETKAVLYLDAVRAKQ